MNISNLSILKKVTLVVVLMGVAAAAIAAVGAQGLGSLGASLKDTGAREEGTIGFATLRGGGVIGDHSVVFAGESEMITLSHRANDRALFAQGALAAARWAFDKKPGFYDMLDVLGFEK